MGELLRCRPLMAAASGEAAPLYPLADGVHNFSSSGSITVSDGKHVDFVRTAGGGSNLYAAIYPLSANTANITSSDNILRVSDTWFRLNAGDTVTLVIENNTGTGSASHNMRIRLHSVTTDALATVIDTQDFKRNLATKSVTTVLENDANIGSLSIWMMSFNSKQSFDISLFVNGKRYI